MKKLTMAETLTLAKENVVEILKDILASQDAIQTGDYSFDIPTVVGDGIEKYVNIKLTAKNTITNDEGVKVEYDPQIVIDRWEFEKAEKASQQAEREKAKAKKLQQAEEKKAKAKALADAKKAKAKKTETE